MNAVAMLFVLASAAALLVLPLRWAPLPLLVGACYMTLGQGIEVGTLSFPVIRILIAVGLARVLFAGKGLAGGTMAPDRLMLAWAAWALASSVFHESPAATFVNRAGLVYNACGLYFLLRVFCRSAEDVVGLCRFTAVVLIPLAAAMVLERSTGRNLFAVFGGVDEISGVRGGIVRAQGPFAHAILAGSVGAASLPLVLVLWRRHRLISIAGTVACATMVVTSASSGPILGALLAVGALAAWRWRGLAPSLRWLAVLGYVVLELVMNAPAYYVLARLDVTGSSTSWHRAELIHAAIEHLPEWWLGGTDYTRHWMPYGVGWSADHIDVTNYYVMMGVYGGIPLMLLLIGVLAGGFSLVGRQLRRFEAERTLPPSALLLWALGSTLFAHAANFMSVSYFDQSVLFLYAALAAICAVVADSRQPEQSPAAPEEPGWKTALERRYA